MKLKTTLKQPAPHDSTRLVSRYLNESIDYGGEPYTRSEVILDMQAQGLTQPEIDRWFQGYELGSRIRARHQRQQLALKQNVATPVKRKSPAEIRKPLPRKHFL